MKLEAVAVARGVLPNNPSRNLFPGLNNAIVNGNGDGAISSALDQPPSHFLSDVSTESELHC